MSLLCSWQIRVNSVNPTVVMTEMGRLAWSNPEKASTVTSRIPLGCFAGQKLQNIQLLAYILYLNTYTAMCMSTEVEDVVNAILFLLSDKSKMINGVTLPVDGGFLAC